ncbi:MAG: hypothetical protein ACTHJ0_01395 [Flavipsychrobacter sp.]
MEAGFSTNYYKDFEIASGEKISLLFVERNIYTFSEAAQFIKALPYKRNTNKKDISCVLIDSHGTCSTKHALLKQLAHENGQGDFKLIMGIFRMNKRNTPIIAPILNQYGLEYIPEAHIYLKYHDLILDYTRKNSTPLDFLSDLLEEKEITPEEVVDFKVGYHKGFITKWQTKEHIDYSPLDLWDIREECINALQGIGLVPQVSGAI